MPYKNILVHLDESKRGVERVKLASQIAIDRKSVV